MVTVGSILGGTARFMRANLRPIAIWSALYLVLGILMRLGLAPVYAAQLAAMQAVQQGMVPAAPPMGTFFLMLVPALLLMLVLYNAVFRAVLFPEDRAAAYLRVGMDEVRLLGLVVLLFLAFFIAMMLLALLITLVGTVVAMVLGASRQGAAVVVSLCMLVVYLGAIFVSVRLSTAAPLTLYRRKIMIGPAWRLTQGRFWRLLGAYVVVALTLIVIALLIMIPTMSAEFSMMGRPGDPLAAQQLAEFRARQMQLSFTPLGIVRLLVSSAIGGILLALFGALPAVATAQLLDEKAGLL